MNKTIQTLILFLFISLNQNLFSQIFNFEKAFIRDSENITIQISIDELNLDTINRISLKNSAVLTYGKSKKIYSDDFLTDMYYDEDSNLFNIVFKAKPKIFNKLKSIEGTFKYLTPSISKNSIQNVNINNSFIEKLVFNDSNIRILYLNAFKIDSLINNKSEFENWKNNIISENNLDKNIFETSISEYLKNRNQFKLPNHLKCNVMFYIENPTFKVVKNTFLKSDSYNSPEVQSEFHSDSWTIWELRYFKNRMPENYTIEFILENDESINEFNFKINLNTD